jgi:hypothetical protein
MKYNFNLKFEYLFALFSLPIFLYAQNPINSIEFSPQMSLSSFSAQDNKMSGIAIGGELIYHFNTSGSPKEWVKMLKLNSIDIVLNYKNMNNITRVTQPISHEFGNSYAVLGALNLPLITFKKLALNFSPGFGLLYVNKTWFTNQNPVIGSHINFASRASLKLIAPINSSAKISAGLDILHYSNAGIRVPNNGMNISSLSLGLIKQFKPVQKEKIDSNSNIKYKEHSFDFGVNIGRRSVYRSKDGLYKSGIYLGYNYRLNELIGLSVGADAVYYFTVFNPDQFLETYQSNATSFDRWRVGVGAGPDVWMGKLALMIKYGYYLHYNSYKPIHTYWTTGMKYKLSNWAAIQAKIYINQTEADFVGFGVIFNK